MGSLLVVLALVALAGGAWWWLRRQQQPATAALPAGGAKPAIPLRVTSPRRYAREGDRKIWELHAPSTACEPARTRNGRKYKADDAPVVPLPGCAHGECSCHYVAIRERRNWMRRQGQDRRDGLRFEPAKDKIDRRVRDRRRSEGGWDDDKRPL